MTKFHLIFAQSSDGYIGKDNDIPWKLPEDMKRFSTLTRNHAVIMGRKTWESLPENFRPLPHRHNIVLTTNGNGSTDFTGASVVGSVTEANRMVQNNGLVWIIGGKAIYDQYMPLASKLYVTDVDVTVGDGVKAPEINPNLWGTPEVVRATSVNGLKYAFKTYERIRW